MTQQGCRKPSAGKNRSSARWRERGSRGRGFSAACSVICKIRYFWVLFAISRSAGVDKGVLYRETHSQVWDRSEQGDTKFGGFRGGEAVGDGGLAGKRRNSRSLHYASTARRGRRGRACLGVVGCGLLRGTPCGGIDMRVGGRRVGLLLRREGETVDAAAIRDQASDGANTN